MTKEKEKAKHEQKREDKAKPANKPSRRRPAAPISANYDADLKKDDARKCIRQRIGQADAIDATVGACEMCGRTAWCEAGAQPGGVYCRALKRMRLPLEPRAEKALERLLKKQGKRKAKRK